MGKHFNRVLVTGGAGYVGSALVPALLADGYEVTVLDLFLYGHDVFGPGRDDPRLQCVAGDLRDPVAVRNALAGCDAVIHLACISNDPSFDLDPLLGKSINYDAFCPLVRAARDSGVKRFVYASSSSVYGVKSEPDVNEDLPLQPLTDYSKYKAMCEDVLHAERQRGFVTVILRPSTVCGYARRQRLDLTVNILTNHAVNRGKITVFGGEQFRPNIHIADMVDVYRAVLAAPDAAVDGKVWNAGYQNYKVREIAEIVQRVLADRIAIETVSTNDNRSYHVSSERIRRELGFAPTHTVEDAVSDLNKAFAAGLLPNSMEDPRYFNIKLMQAVNLR